MAPNARQALVLVVDHHPEILAEMSTALGEANYRVQCCSEPETAIDLAEKTLPDLLIAGLNLQGRSGVEVWHQIRGRAGLEELPAMFLSGAQIPDIIRRSHAAGGACYYLRKPIERSVLLELVEKALWMPHLVRRHLHLHSEAERPAPNFARQGASEFSVRA